MKKWRIALIGCGAMGRVHADPISRLDEMDMVLAVDQDRQRAETFQKEFGFHRSGTDWREAVESPDVDIAIVATHAESHHEICKALLEAGKHVICEKPYSSQLEQVREIQQVAQATGGKIRVGFVLRFSPAMKVIHDLLHNGAIGPKPWFYRTTLSQTPALERMEEGWAYYARLIDNAGSATADCGIHYVDLFRWWTGEDVTHVSSVGVVTENNPVPKGHNLGLLTMNLSGGSAGWIEDNWSRVARSWNEMELLGPEGRIWFQFSEFRSESWLRREGHGIELFTRKTRRTELVPVPSAGVEGKQTGSQLRELIRMIEQNESSAKHLDDVYKCTEVVIAANIAAEEKRTVALPM